MVKLVQKRKKKIYNFKKFKKPNLKEGDKV